MAHIFADESSLIHFLIVNFCDTVAMKCNKVTLVPNRCFYKFENVYITANFLLVFPLPFEINGFSPACITFMDSACMSCNTFASNLTLTE